MDEDEKLIDWLIKDFFAGLPAIPSFGLERDDLKEEQNEMAQELVTWCSPKKSFCIFWSLEW